MGKSQPVSLIYVLAVDVLLLLAPMKFQAAEVDAVDISADALEVAEFNIENHGLIHRVYPMQSDLFEAIVPPPYDIIRDESTLR